jgi:peptidyl-prolyl cis-trans isomerase B (cyclophilin B)
MNRWSSAASGVRVAACLAALLGAGCAAGPADEYSVCGRTASERATGEAQAAGRTAPRDAQSTAAVDSPDAASRGGSGFGSKTGGDVGAHGGKTGGDSGATIAGSSTAGSAIAGGATTGGTAASGAAAGGAVVIEGGPSAALGEGGPESGPPPLPTAADIERFRSLVAELRTNKGTIVFGFLPDAAPYTVQNFVVLAGRGYYDGTAFHRVIPGFVAQGGDPEGTGHGGPGYMIKGEFSDVKHVRGVVSMARLTHPDTAGSQFFICLAEAKHLDGGYAAFGRVLGGSDVLEKIEAAGSKGGTPSDPITLTRVVIRERTQAEIQAETQSASHDS